MANFTYTLLSTNNPQIPPDAAYNLTYERAFYFFFETDFSDLDILDSIDATLTMTRANWNGVSSFNWFWSSVTTIDAITSNNSTDRTSDMETLKSYWVKTKPYLVARFGWTPTGTGNSQVTFKSYNITATGRGPKPTVSIGDPITKAQMDLLREYKFNTPTEVTQYDTITVAVGTTYNAAITQNSTISAS